MYSNKRIWSISYPILLGLLAQNVINITDTAFLGHVSEVALGASALGGLFYICIFTVAFGFSIGSQIVIARRNGEKQYHSIGAVMIQGCIFLLVLAVLLFGLTRMFGGDVMRFLVSSDVIYDATMEYINWRIFGFFFSFVSVMFRAFYIGITHTKVLTINSIILALINILLDYTLIFGKFGFPEMGIKGAAIASVIAECCSILFFLIYTYITVDLKKYGFKEFRSFDLSLLTRILNISSFTMLQYFLSMSTFFVFFMVMERIGQRELAISNIIRSIYILMYIPVNALSTTTNSMVSNIIGAGQIEHVMALIKKIARFDLLIMLIFAGLIALFPNQILSVYTQDSSLIRDCIPSIYVICAAMVVASVSSVMFNAISGTGNTRSALILEIGTLFFYIIYMFVVGVVFRASVGVCFTTELVYHFLLLIASYIYLKNANWQSKKV